MPQKIESNSAQNVSSFSDKNVDLVSCRQPIPSHCILLQYMTKAAMSTQQITYDTTILICGIIDCFLILYRILNASIYESEM
jgi:hypothetical protein